MGERHGEVESRALRSTLLAARNPDGGWPDYRGKASRLEPTVAALLAFDALGEPVGAGVLERWPREDGLLVGQGGQVNVGFNGVAALALAAGRTAPLARDLERGLVRARGLSIPPSTVNRQDNSIQAWAWTDDTFSWVEPTAWCLLGLKKLTAGARTPEAARRIAGGERLLADRECRGGGWNHGNSNMLGTELPAYVPTTALALLALHDRAGDRMVAESLHYLQGHRTAETGGMALALTSICLGVYGASAGDVDAAIDWEWRRSAFVGNLHVAALALYARSGAAGGFEAFRV